MKAYRLRFTVTWPPAMKKETGILDITEERTVIAAASFPEEAIERTTKRIQNERHYCPTGSLHHHRYGTVNFKSCELLDAHFYYVGDICHHSDDNYEPKAFTEAKDE